MADKDNQLAEIDMQYNILIKNNQRLTLQQIKNSSDSQTHHTSCDNTAYIHEIPPPSE